MFKKVILALGCIPIPFLESLVIYMYLSEGLGRLKMVPFKTGDEAGTFLIILTIIIVLLNIFLFFKSSKKRFERIYFLALIIGFPMICFCCYLLFYYFPFVHTPQGMGTVIQVYFFIAFVFLIFLLRKLITLIISKLKK